MSYWSVLELRPGFGCINVRMVFTCRHNVPMRLDVGVGFSNIRQKMTELVDDTDIFFDNSMFTLILELLYLENMEKRTTVAARHFTQHALTTNHRH